jgi:formylmethanofuran dehydrogenase subunit E
MEEEGVTEEPGRYEYKVLDEGRVCSVCGEESEEGVEDHQLDAWLCAECAAEEGVL